MYALFDADGKLVSKVHSTKEAVATEAYEAGLVQVVRYRKALAPGYEIKEVKQ